MEKTNQEQEDKKLIEGKLASFDFLARINSILARMKESNVGIVQTKPIETKSKHKTAVMKVEFPKEGGVYTYYEGMEYPTKGFCYGEMVETVDMVKKIAMGVFKGLYDSLSGNKLKGLLMLLIFRKQFTGFGLHLLREFDYSLSRVRLKPERYCISARELFRVFDLFRKWYPKMDSDIARIRNLICMMWEYDDAYRYTFQDVFAEIDKEAVRKDVVKELIRMIDLITQRELEFENTKLEDTRTALKFQKIKKMMFLIRFVPKIKEALKRFFLELNYDRIKMDKADRYHASFKWGYNWRMKKPELKGTPINQDLGKAHEQLRVDTNNNKEKQNGQV